jgi:2-polyprenyl-3-methyl-5-hydroxy-6-metoxy-1,4-benzoquinol methylase
MSKSNFASLLDLEELPFFFGLLSEDQIRHSDLPHFLPFNWGVNLENGLFGQAVNADVENALRKVYMSPVTIAPPSGQGDFADLSVNAIVDVLEGFMPAKSVKGKAVLEIGCSNGLLLSHYVKHGAYCTGIEPGPQSEICIQRSGIKVIRNFFEDVNIDEKFDFIYSINVLEHISDLNKFVCKLSTLLKPGGIFVSAVPDSSLEMSSITPNIFVHEHYWYFTQSTLTDYLYRKGFSRITATKSPFGSNFFIGGIWSEANHIINPVASNTQGDELIHRGKKFVRDLNLMLGALQSKIDGYSNAVSHSIGLYGASNAINYLGLLDWKIPPKIFDTDRANQGKFLWTSNGASIIVEEPNINVLNTLEEIWILPISHQKLITQDLVQKGVDINRIRNHRGELFDLR